MLLSLPLQYFAGISSSIKVNVKLSFSFIRLYVTKARDEVQVEPHALLISEFDTSSWLASRSVSFTLGQVTAN